MDHVAEQKKRLMKKAGTASVAVAIILIGIKVYAWIEKGGGSAWPDPGTSWKAHPGR